MGLFSFFSKAKELANKTLNPEYAKNQDFLEAVASVAAFVASADGSVDESEKKATIDLLVNHPQLGKLYSKNDITNVTEKMFGRTSSALGRQQLTRELDDLNNKPGATQMKQDAYYVGVDVASADGNVSPQEEEILKKIAARLGIKVDASDSL